MHLRITSKILREAWHGIKLPLQIMSPSVCLTPTKHNFMVVKILGVNFCNFELLTLTPNDSPYWNARHQQTSCSLIQR